MKKKANDFDFFTKWLTFTEFRFPNKKTQIWHVASIKGIFLGEIKWFSRWRCYAFFPQKETIFNSVCLNDIRNFIDNLMKDRKK